jgi:hypothetical protein
MHSQYVTLIALPRQQWFCEYSTNFGLQVNWLCCYNSCFISQVAARRFVKDEKNLKYAMEDGLGWSQYFTENNWQSIVENENIIFHVCVCVCVCVCAYV